MSEPHQQEQSQTAVERATSQRNRILDAAEKCFIKHGFHAASMSNISQTAEMSAGLIYRYFENKNAIILAIIERQLDERRANIATLHTDEDFLAKVTDLFECWLRRDPKFVNPALFLEMSAEATRDPQIAAALHAGDLECRADFAEWLKRRAEENGLKPVEEDCRVRALALGCFIEGMAVRAVREPDLDPKLLAACVQRFVPEMLAFKRKG